MLEKIIKDYKNTSSQKVRSKYGYLASFVSLACNIILAVSKITVGAIFNSVSVLADGLNNLTDGASSVVSIVGFKISNKPADREHPYGHARLEYIVSLIISVIILFIGLQLVISSVNNIISPVELEYSVYMIVVLAVSIFVKLCLYFYNIYLAKKINSLTLKATAMDSLTDSLITSAVLISTLVGMYLGVNTDSYFGIVVAIFIIYSGLMLIRETLSPLLGEKMNESELNKIVSKVKSYEGVKGVHDVQAHNYGPNKYFIILHVEVDSKVDIMVSHELIDRIENEVSNEDINLVIHMDPIVTDDPVLDKYKAIEQQIVLSINSECTLHDFRMINRLNFTNLIFDVRVPFTDKRTDDEIKQLIQLKTTEQDIKLKTIINIDRF